MTAIAADTFYTTDPTTRQKRRNRIELRRMPTIVEKDENGKDVRYTHGIWSDGRYTEKLTLEDAKQRLYTRQGGIAWSEVNPDLL